MLERAALLLNPEAIRTTKTGEQSQWAEIPLGPAAVRGTQEHCPGENPAGRDDGELPRLGRFRQPRFPREASAVGLNMVPDKDGIIS